MPPTIFISGHLDLTPEEFEAHYVPKLETAVRMGWDFVVGDARGADSMAQAWLAERRASAKVFHMLESPRNHLGDFPLMGGFPTDQARDEAMTEASDEDIAWARPTSRGRRSGTAKNLERRQAKTQRLEDERDRSERLAFPRFHVDEYEMFPVYGMRPAREDDHRPIPMPAALLERYRAARKEWDVVQGEIVAWQQKQERNPL